MGVALVTGASRGIGARIAQGLAARGHTVWAGMREPRATTAPGTGDLRPVRLDVTCPEEIQNAVDEVLARHGRIDLLVNNAGVAWFAPAEEMSETLLRTTFETNFFGAVRCTQAVLPAMRAQGEGRIVMVSTLAAATGLPLESAYCASKSALEAFAESLRYEVERFGVRVAVLEPGVTEGGLSTSTPDPEAPATSPYDALLAHTFAFYEAAQAERDDAELVVDAVAEVADDSGKGFRRRLGAQAPLIEQVLRATEEQAADAVREALGIEWWRNGQEEHP